MLYYIVCFYNEKLTGPFTVDYIYRDKANAVKTIVSYIKKSMSEEPRTYWPVLYETDSLSIQQGDCDDYHVYLDNTKKKLYIFVNQQNLKNLQYDKIPMPPISTRAESFQ